MYDIYIKNYINTSGVEVETEKLMYSVPIINSDVALLDPRVKDEMGKAGTFEFSIAPGNPYYNCWLQMKTIMRVMYDGNKIFRGRVLTIDNTLAGGKKIHLEGDIAFFQDTMYEGAKTDNRPKTDCLTYLHKLIDNHNSQCGREDKKFRLGEVPGQYSNAIPPEQRINPDTSYKYGSESWQKTADALSELTNSFGGYLRTRYADGYAYLDWLNSCFNTDIHTQPITVGKNLIDMSNSTEVDNIFTAIIPIGKDVDNHSNPIYVEGIHEEIHGSNRYITVPQICQVFSDEQLNQGYHTKSDYLNAINKYGYIYKTVKFENANTKEKVWEYATDWIKNNYNGGVTNFTVSALDMHHLGSGDRPYLTGDKIPVIYPDIDNRNNDETKNIQKILTCTSIDFYLYHPEKNQYALGIPNSIADKEYGFAVKASKGKSSGGGGGISKPPDDNNGDKEKNEIADSTIWEVIMRDAETNPKIKAIADPQTKAHALDVNYIIMRSQADTGYEPDVQWANKINMFLDGPNGAVNLYNIKKENIGYELEQRRAIELNGGEGKIEMFAPPDQWRAKQNKSGIPTITVKGPLAKIDFNTVAELSKPQSTTDKIIGSLTGNTISLDGKNGLIDLNLFNFNTDGSIKDILPSIGLSGKDSNVKISAIKDLLKDGSANISKYVPSFELNGKESKFSLFGLFSDDKDETGAKDVETLILDAQNGKIEGSDSEGKTTVQVDSMTGVEKIGKNLEDEWSVILNDTVRYRDENSKWCESSGFVTAKDFQIDTIPSFKTKMAIVDKLFANQAEINELTVNKIATINQIVAKAITTDTIESKLSDFINTWSEEIRCVSLDASYFIGTREIDADIINGFEGAQESKFIVDGQIAGYFLGAGDINFNIADTQTYRTAVRNATKQGQDAMGVSIEMSGESPTGNIYVAASPTKKIRVSAILQPYNSGGKQGFRAVAMAGGRVIAQSDVQYASGYNEGWNACIDAAESHRVLKGFSSWKNGELKRLYDMDDGVMTLATGATQRWRYGGTLDTMYTLPAKK